MIVLLEILVYNVTVQNQVLIEKEGDNDFCLNLHVNTFQYQS